MTGDIFADVSLRNPQIITPNFDMLAKTGLFSIDTMSTDIASPRELLSYQADGLTTATSGTLPQLSEVGLNINIIMPS